MAEFTIGDPVRVARRFLSHDPTEHHGKIGKVVDYAPWKYFPVKVELQDAARAFWFHPRELAHAASWLSPDCRDGNHHKCYGDAWDTEADQQTKCGCSCHG